MERRKLNKVNLNDLSSVFDVALSFAGEDRTIVSEFANALVEKGYSVFYDLFYQSDLLGKDLVVWLRKIYGERTRHCLVFISANYSTKKWPNRVERQAILDRSIQDDNDFIIPVVLDDSWIDGLPSTVGYLDARTLSTDEMLRVLCTKLGNPTLPKEERSQFWSLMGNPELIGRILVTFSKADKDSYYHYGGWNSTLERMSRFGQMLKSYKLASVEYENDDMEPGIWIDLTEKGKRFRRFLITELAQQR